MNDEIEKMARDFFGFGRWDAPYWFIRPEPGGEDNSKRAEAFAELGSDGLCDCAKFHCKIGIDRWHGLHGAKAAAQSTWRRLILLLKAFRSECTDLSQIREYQVSKWGKQDGENCVIELAGLSARSETESTIVNRETNRKYLNERICKIRNKIQSSSTLPELVVVYGKAGQKDWATAKTQWEKITWHALEFKRALKYDNTVFVFTPHPQAHGYRDEDWADWVRNVEKRQ